MQIQVIRAAVSISERVCLIVYSNVISDFTYYFLVVSVYAAMAKQHDPRSWNLLHMKEHEYI